MNKLEAKFQVRFKHYLEKNPPTTSAAYELKYERTARFNFHQWVEKSGHQLRSLLNAKHKYLYHKISDSGIGQKPMDMFVLAGADAWLVIYFELQQQSIFVNTEFTLELLQSGKKSATFDELAEDNRNKIIQI